MRKTHILLISEYTTEQSPVGILNVDVLNHFKNHETINFSTFSCSGKYHPGGTHPVRMRNLLLMHFLAPFVLIFYKLKSLFKNQHLKILVTTSPPVLHLNVLIWAKLFFIPRLVWFQDAHPELEARILEKKDYNNAAKLLRLSERAILPFASTIIALDDAMKKGLEARARRNLPIAIIHPWATFMTPAKALRAPQNKSSLSFIYAGNYGQAHDLSPLIETLKMLELETQKSFSFTFIGMNANSQYTIKNMFSNLHCPTYFLERLKSASDLPSLFDTFDFGIVSLAEDYAGLACPSKAYTYVSQGLPILYVGPVDTLSDELVKEGWGIHKENLTTAQIELSKAHDIFLNPQKKALAQFEDLILS